MNTALLAAVVALQSGAIERGPYGVATIVAPNREAAVRLMGKAVAEDRLWQMELSRRAARGRLAEVLGPTAAASDRETLLSSYTDEELQTQIEGLPKDVGRLYEAYADGVNEAIAEAERKGELPAGYAQNDFKPEPWTPVDSAAISALMARRFGGGGAGELRNYALLTYLKTQPAKDRALDVFDDLAWQNDPRSIPTLAPKDDPLAKNPPRFPRPSRAQTEAHLKALPPANLLEMVPAIGLAQADESAKYAAANALPYKWGSYAVVVSPQRSRLGVPLLLGAPQMGHATPSIPYEIGVRSPGMTVRGMTVPGLIGVQIGMTPNLAWTLTTSVADTTDVFYSPLDGADGYLCGSERRSLQRVVRTLKVKGRPDAEVVQLRTHFGPVVLNSATGKVVYSVRRSYWMRDLEGFATLFDLYGARTGQEVQAVAKRIPVGFNLFFATTSGDIGWRYCGLMPVRAPGSDPRLPLAGTPENDWRGFLAPEQMPAATNPSTGMLANWNNKPVAWWPNLDTPVWGRLFRNQELLDALGNGPWDAYDLERAAWTIARRDQSTNAAFMPLARRSLVGYGADDKARTIARSLLAYDGWRVEGSIGAGAYAAWVRALRRELFERHVGNMVQRDLFETAIQPSLMLNAVEGKTKYDFLAGRKAEDVARAAFDQVVAATKAPADLAFVPSRISLPDQPPVPYLDRGSYIQVIELFGTPRGRNVLGPGVAESGPHAFDQVPLLRNWGLKEMGE